MLKKIFRRNIDTRVFPRIKLYNFVRYKLQAEPDANFAVANVKDISAGGVLFVCKGELGQGAIIDITINFPAVEPIDIKAQVVRTRRTNSGEYEIGAYFITIDEAKKDELARRIEFILKKLREKKSFLGQIRRAFRSK